MMLACVLALVVSVSSAFGALPSRAIATRESVAAASAAFAIDDSEATQRRGGAGRQKVRKYSDTRGGAESLQQQNTISNSTVASARPHEPVIQMHALSSVNAKLGGGNVLGDEASRAESARSDASARLGSIPSGDPVYDTWKLRLEKSLLHAISRAATKTNDVTARSLDFMPRSAQHSSDAKSSRPKNAEIAKAVLDANGGNATPPAPGKGVQARSPSNRTSVGSLVGSMAMAIKESASKLEHDKLEAKREQAEARRQMDEAKHEQAKAKHEQEEAQRERLEAKHMLAKAKRANNAALAAGAISPSRGGSHPQLQPRLQEQRREQLDDAPEPLHARSPSLPDAGSASKDHLREPGTPASGEPSRVDVAELSAMGARSAQSTRSEHKGFAWKMFGMGEWRLASAAVPRAAPEGSRERNKPSSEDLLNAELAMRLGLSAQHAGEARAGQGSANEVDGVSGVLRSVDALDAALHGAAAPSPQ